MTSSFFFIFSFFFLFCFFYLLLFFFFFNDTATTEIYTLSLHDALPINLSPEPEYPVNLGTACPKGWEDRKSTRLNSSHITISYAVFCLKKKKNKKKLINMTKKKNNILTKINNKKI